jgi:hypothetical protein
MASLRVPDEYVGGLAKFLGLSVESGDKLLSALEQSPVSQEPREALKEKLSALGIVPNSDVDDIADAVMSLYFVCAHSDESPSDLAAEITQAINESSSEKLKLPDETRANIKSRLTRLLSVDSFAISVKADSYLYEYDNVFSKAHISTDIRPIFGVNPEEPPKVATLNHMMNIHYYHDGEHKELYLALDAFDLDSLRNVIDRAALKAESLKQVLDAAGLTRIGPE